MENSTEQSQKSKEVFLTMVGLLGLNSEVKDKVSGRNIILSVSTDEPGRLIGRNGSSLDNVGLLMNRILKKTDNTFPKVIIDVDGYDKKPKREKRKSGGNRKDRKQKQDKMEKTTVMSEAPADDQINVYIDHETDKLVPVTTVALNHSDSSDYSRPQKRERRDNRDAKRGNRRDGKRTERRRDDKRERAPQAKKEAVPAAVASESAPAAAQPEAVIEQNTSADKGGKPVNKLQMQCRNAAKEVKRWGEDILLPPLSEADCQKAIEYFGKENEVNAQVDNSRSYGDKKRVRISLKK